MVANLFQIQVTPREQKTITAHRSIPIKHEKSVVNISSFQS